MLGVKVSKTWQMDDLADLSQIRLVTTVLLRVVNRLLNSVPTIFKFKMQILKKSQFNI
jgi:hypothetical protein